MTEEEKKAQLLKEIEDNVKEIITDSQKEFVTNSAIEDKIKSLNEKIAENLTDDDIKELKQKVDNLAEKNQELHAELKAVKEDKMVEDEKPKSFRDIMKSAIMEKKDIVLTEKNDDYGKRFSLKDFFTEKGNQNTPSFTLKAAVDMLESNIVQNYVNELRLTQLDPQRVSIPLTLYPHVVDVLPKKTLNRPTMALLVVYDYTDGSGTKTEGSASSKSSFLFKTVSFPAFYIATYFTLSDETLDDLEEALDEINLVAPSKINDKIDTKVLGATGDDSSDIAGLFTATKHTDFSTATYASYAVNPHLADLVTAMKDQCETNKYMPDSLWMNPRDVAKYSTDKNAIEDGRFDRRVAYNPIGEPIAIAGLPIRKSTAITADTMAVVDIKQLMLGIRKDMTMEIGYNGTDLTEGQKTVVIKTRVAFGVRDKAAVIYSDSVADDIEAIEKVTQ